jgi:single-strand DNA-binding protein
MRTFQVIHLVGRVRHDAEVRYLPDGQARTRFSLATDRPARAGAEAQEDWHQVVCWGPLAEFACEHLTKGRLVCVVGRIAYRSYDRDGQTHHVAEVIAHDVTLLDRRPAGAEEDPAA